MKTKLFKHPIIFISLLFLICSAVFAKDFPVSVNDGNQRTVTMKKAPKKIISLGAASTEILFEVGAEKQIAAVSDVSNYPEAAKKIPTIGGFDAKTLSIEKILSFKPDFVIAYSGMHDFLFPLLEKFKIPYYVSNAATVEDVIDEIKDIAYLTGHKNKGDSLENEYKKILLDIEKVIVSDNKPTVFWEVYNAPYMSVGNQSFIHDVITKSGGKNIFEDVDQAYPMVSEETIIASNPNFILIPNDMYSSIDSVKERAAWKNMDAIKNNKIIIFDADIYTRPGPRIFSAIKNLHKIIYKK